MDLLDPLEELERENVFDVELLAERLLTAADWVSREPETRKPAVGYFGRAQERRASSRRPAGRAGPGWCSRGRPTSRRRGSRRSSRRRSSSSEARTRVIELNEAAQTELRCTRRLVVVPGATHLFEEPGALETVADLAAGWFARHIRPLAGA
jgi:hypothetical protein